MHDVNTHMPRLSHVTVHFNDGADSLLLYADATLTELAAQIGVLGTQHVGKPVSIDIEFISARTSARTRRGSRSI